jgi:lysophospholipase L1-like esterase
MSDNRAEQPEDLDARHLIPHGSSFRPDPYLYRVLQPGQDFLDEDGFSSYDEAVARIRSNGKSVILSFGDSYTSGWDTRIAPLNRQRKARSLPLISSFFRYRTYTDYLRHKIGDRYEILNAAIPGHTALTGLRRFRILSQRLRHDGIRIAYTLSCFGANDSFWEGNFRDRWHLALHPRSPRQLEVLRRRLHHFTKDQVILRSTPQDYGRYTRQLIADARRIGAPAVLVEQQTTLYWEPGARFAPYDFDAMAKKPGGALALQRLEQARELWQAAIDMPYSDRKISALQAALDQDVLLPRIKSAYVDELRRVAAATQTPLVSVPMPRSVDEKQYFIDYAHPHTSVNEQIADRIVAALSSLNKRYMSGS